MIPTLVTDVQVHRSKTESNNGRPKNSENVMVAADVHINHHSQNETEVLKDRVISFSTLSYLDMGTKIKCVFSKINLCPYLHFSGKLSKIHEYSYGSKSNIYDQWMDLWKF